MGEDATLHKWMGYHLVTPRRVGLLVGAVVVALLLVTLLVLALTLWRQSAEPPPTKTSGYEVVGYRPTDYMDTDTVPDSEIVRARQDAVLWNEEHCLDMAPGQRSIPLHIIYDVYSEELSFPSIYHEVNFTLSNKLTLIPRKEWLAQPVTTPPEPLSTPVPYVIVSHTVTEDCQVQAQCVLRVRLMQTFDIESRGFWDIRYNFLVGGDGFAYVGRGWDSEGSHAFGYNNCSIGIGFLGTFKTVKPSEKQHLAFQRLVEVGLERGKIAKDYKLLSLKQVSNTNTPAEKLYEEIKNWPHWAESP